MQSIALKIQENSLPCPIKFMAMYGKCNKDDKQELWEDIYGQCNFPLPIIVGGDFNVVTYPLEKLGGNGIDLEACTQFNNTLGAAGLSEIP